MYEQIRHKEVAPSRRDLVGHVWQWGQRIQYSCQAEVSQLYTTVAGQKKI